MRFRYFFGSNHKGPCWFLQTPPCTSSSWDTVYLPGLGKYAECRWRWPLYWVAHWVRFKDDWSRPLTRKPKKNDVIEFRL